jgi:acyl-CoA thioesterase-1
MGNRRQSTQARLSARTPRAYGLGLWVVNAALAAFLFAGSAVSAQEKPRLLVLGDSLAAGYGLPRDQAFPVKLDAWLRNAGVDAIVINGGVSGDTSAGGLARLDWILGGEKPNFAIIELGANDGLRGLPPAALADNLDKILARLKTAGVKALLTGMYAPRNLGRDYADEFDAVYPRLAAKHSVPLYPFFLDGVATDAALNQGDGLHPNAKGVDIIVDRIGPQVKKLISGG